MNLQFSKDHCKKNKNQEALKYKSCCVIWYKIKRELGSKKIEML